MVDASSTRSFTISTPLPGDIDIRFSTIPSSIVRDADGVDVTFTSNVDGSTSAERFDADDRAC